MPVPRALFQSMLENQFSTEVVSVLEYSVGEVNPSLEITSEEIPAGLSHLLESPQVLLTSVERI